MAEAVLTSVLVKLAQFLADRYTELQAVHGQFEKMEGELNLMEALLRVADSKRNRNVLIEAWLNEVRKIAKRITNLIDAFPDKTEQNQTESSNWFRRTTTKITTDVKRTYKAYIDNLPGKIEGITNDLNSIYMRGIQMGIMDDLRALDDVDDPDPSEEVDDPNPSEKVADPEVVGLENDKGKIIEHLQTKNIKRRTVLSIVGTGGLGKTTLAQKVYKSAKLNEEFDCRAWLSISQKYIFNDFLKEILYSVEPRRKKNPPITDGDIVMNLRSALRGKRYLIILDDVWDTNLWEQLEVALPDPDNASRVIITTRSLDIAKAADCNTQPYDLSYLSDAEGLALLFRKAFQQHIPPEDYYRDLLEVAERLMKKCGGLPLALVVLSGILRRRNRTYSAWSKVDETMCWHKEDGEKCMKILATSYEELPNHLKLCFLYFAGFPEDYKISGRQIMGMWMAEGFIPEDGGGTMMDRAEEWLQELVQRPTTYQSEHEHRNSCRLTIY